MPPAPTRSRRSQGEMGAPPASSSAAAGAAGAAEVAADHSAAARVPVSKRRRLSPAQQRSGSTTVSQAAAKEGNGNGREEEDAVSTPVVSGCSLNTVMNKGFELLKQRNMGGVARMMIEGIAVTSPMKSAVVNDDGEEQPCIIDDIWKTVAKKVLYEMNMKFIDIDGKEAQEAKGNGVLEEVEKPDTDEALLELAQTFYQKLMSKKQEQVEMKVAVQQLYLRMVEAELKSKHKEEHLEALQHEIDKVKDEVESVRRKLQQELKECEKKLSAAKQEATAAAKEAVAAKEEASAVKEEANAAKEKASAARKEAKVAEFEAIKLKREVDELKRKLVNKDGAIRLLNKSIVDPQGTFEKVFHDYTKLKNQLSSPTSTCAQSYAV